MAPAEWVSASAPPFDGKLLELGVHSDSSSSYPVSRMALEPVTLIQQQCLPADPGVEPVSNRLGSIESLEEV